MRRCAAAGWARERARKAQRNERAVKAALLIQTWYRRCKAEIEIRRRCAWKIYEFFEYSAAEDEQNLRDFFTWLLDTFAAPPTQTEDESHREKSIFKSRFSHGLEAQFQKLGLPGKTRVMSLRVAGKEAAKPIIFGTEKLKYLVDYLRHDKLLDSEFVIEVLEESTKVLQTLPNVQRASTTISQKLTICGDLHGQLEDLLLIFTVNGLPDILNPYVFNGDFVDRGRRSVEVLTLLLTCLISHPSAVFLNRGNHEDSLVNKRYGFESEIKQKYPKRAKKILKLTEQVYSSLPICTMIDDVIFVCHGGISRTTDLNRVISLNRETFSSVLQPQLEGENAVSLDDWRQILDLLWSDPQSTPGSRPNLKRGGGSYFGPDVTSNRLSQMKMGLLVRSHECCPQGWKLDHNQSVLTIFSASNYYGQNSNMGAFLHLTSRRFYEVTPAAKSPERKVTILAPVEATALPDDTAGGRRPNCSDLQETAYTPSACSTQLLARPSSDASKIYTCSSRRRKIKGDGTDRNIELVIQPKAVKFKCGKGGAGNRFDRNGSEDAAFQLLCKRMLAKRQELLAAFQACDPEKTALVSVNNFCATCEHLHSSQGKTFDAKAIQKVAFLIDFNNDGYIDFNEFVEAARLATSECKSGQCE
ncbi:hypothetical protein SprV_0401502300 [Sparganum proliferum]